MQLSDEQLAFWDTFGYLLFPQLFAPDEVGWITSEFERVVQLDDATAGKHSPGGYSHSDATLYIFMCGSPCKIHGAA